MSTQFQEAQVLGIDLNEMYAAVTAHPELFRVLKPSLDAATHNYYTVVADLFFRIHNCASGICLLLEHDLHSPALPVQRSMFEAVTTLRYMHIQKDPIREAANLRAYSLVKESALFPDERAEERERILSEMPQDVVESARKRVQNRHTWSGKPLKQMAEETGFRHAIYYNYVSEDVHARTLGDHVAVQERDGRHELRLGRTLPPDELEAMANFTRRLLHCAFAVFWSAFHGPEIELHTTNPNEWLRRASEAQPPEETDS